MIKQTFPLFGTQIEFRIYDVEEDDFVTLGTLDELYKEALRLQKIFNFFDPKSELNSLNIKRSVAVSKELLEVITVAKRYSELTNGKYDITHGREFMLRKKGQEFETQKCSYKDIHIDKNVITLLNDDVMIDLGSIAKGYIADKLVEYMQSLGIEHGFVDARGDMKIFGSIPEVIEIQHPRLDEGIHPLIFENTSVATSGDYHQYIKDFRINHIIGNKDLISVTVFHDSLMHADAIATCLMVVGKERAIQFCKEHNIKALLIDELKEYPINNIEKNYLEDSEWIGRHY